MAKSKTQIAALEDRLSELEQALQEFELREHDGDDQLEVLATELRDRSEDLHDSEQKLRNLQAIIDSMGDALVVYDEGGKLLFFNPAARQILGIEDSELGAEWTSYCAVYLADPSDSSAGLASPFVRAVRGQAVDNEELQARHLGGEGWLSVTARPLKAPDASYVGGVAVIRDITEDKRVAKDLLDAKEGAEAATRAKSEFLANMSHEIRTPMAAILGFVEMLEDPDQDEDERYRAVEIIRKNGEYLLNLINDILDLSKIEAGRMTMIEKECSPFDLIYEVISLVSPRATATQLDLSVAYDTALPETVRTDPLRVRQILINLIGNAIKFTERGSVRLIASLTDTKAESGPLLQFDVVDTGIGMTEEHASKLFLAFSQADASMSRRFGGTGLGLSISRRLARILGGDVTLVESASGVGTRFRATVQTGPIEGIKMLDTPPERSTQRDSIDHTKLMLDGGRILAAEDGQDNRRLLGLILKKAGLEATFVENGAVAMEMALGAREEGEPFDVILMDMQMPVMDGYEATAQLRKAGYTEPIIAVTAHAMAGERDKCIQAGCDDFVTKPLERKRLLGAISRYIGKRSDP